MRILFLSPRQCWPPRSGAKLREYHFAKALGERAQLSYLCFSEPGSAPLTQADLPFCEHVISLPKPPAYTLTKIIQGLFGRWPLPVLNYSSKTMATAALELALASHYDLVHLDSIHMAKYLETIRPAIANPRVVYNWHNIESELMRRYSETTASGARRLYARYTSATLATLESKLLASSFGHVVCSQREKDQLTRIAPSARIAIVENGVDTAYFRQSADGPRNWLVFVGLMNYHANFEAIISFARTVWPGISARFPELGLRVVGAQPVPGVLALREIPRVQVTGTVTDVRPYYANALAAIVPLRTGGGTRLKILEAMAAGVPVISTTFGAEGLNIQPDSNILMADGDDSESWIRSIACLIDSPERFRRIAAAARKLVESQYDWRILGARLTDTYEVWLRNIA
jgi:polysaccharide biosynthesis protein PslH